MREYELIIDEALRKGLSPDKIPNNAQFLFECLGFRCGIGRLESHVPLTNPIPVTIDMYYSWPFPQFLVGEEFHIMVVRDTVNQEDDVYLVSEDHATVTPIFQVDVLTFGKGTLMEMADFGEYVFMTNGVLMIYWDLTLGAWQVMTSSTLIPMMRTICNFKGMAVGGCVLSPWYDCDETFFIWTRPGYMDFTPSQENETGYRRCPYGGEVYHVRRLGDIVVGYSSKGVTFLIPSSEPTPTMGFMEMCNIGLINRGAMNGSLNRHIFVGEDYIVREVTKEGVKELGYQYYMEQLTNGDIIVTYNPHKKDFYISDGTKTFLLSPFGMTEVLQHPSAVWRSNGSSYIIPEVIDSRSPLICTEPFDMGYRGQKTISSIETDAHITLDPEAGVDYSSLAGWIIEHYKPINNEGIAAITVSGDTFRFRLRFEAVYDNTVISYLKARYKMTDLRGIRGVYAPPLRGQ